MSSITSPPLSAVLGAIPSYPRPVIERLVARLIERLDEQDGDPELEGDPFNEGEPAFDAVSRAMVNEHPRHNPDNDAEPSAWLERDDQTLAPYGNEASADYRNGEDCEDDDPGEDENDAEPDNDGDCGEHGIDQRKVIHWGGTWSDL